ncbi:hypothetical protein AVEN_231553-1 [Araneus ventricosus]|uniref:Uncharacterized protein n=1 Tax=Araneus ventricosus TaxID=182803 RepID=A0A4Y2JH86_ARAVE|nr:hypothetical protein AVEN_231553-1 [Araneus ventricosus]
MPEGAGVTVPNEPDGNSDLDEQMEMSPSLAANPTPIQVRREIPDLTPFFRRAVATYEKPVSDQRCHPAPGQAAKPSVHGQGVRRSNPDAGRWKYSVIGRDDSANPERNHQQMGE